MGIISYLSITTLEILISHYSDVIMTTTASQITSLTIVYSIVYLDADQRKHQSSTSLAFVWGIHRWPVNYPHNRPVTQKMFPFDDIIMWCLLRIHIPKLWPESFTKWKYNREPISKLSIKRLFGGKITGRTWIEYTNTNKRREISRDFKFLSSDTATQYSVLLC